MNIVSIPACARNPLSITWLLRKCVILPPGNVYLYYWYKACWIVRQKREKDNIRGPCSGINTEAGAMMNQSTVATLYPVHTLDNLFQMMLVNTCLILWWLHESHASMQQRQSRVICTHVNKRVFTQPKQHPTHPIITLCLQVLEAGEKHIPKSSHSKRVTSLLLFPLRII